MNKKFNILKKWKVTTGIALVLSWLALTFSSYGILVSSSYHDKHYDGYSECRYFTGVVC